MAEMVVAAEEEQVAPAPPRHRVTRGIGIAMLALVALLLAAGWGIDTSIGHRLIADRVAALTPSSGLRIRIGRIDGSIWRHATLRDVRLSDLDGQFFEAPEIALAWHPLAWARNRLDIDRLRAPLVQLARMPRLRSTGGATLPGFDIRIGALDVGALRLGPAIAGRAQTARVSARADIRHGRAAIGLHLASTTHDRVTLDLDATPDSGRFRLGGTLDGPTGGVIAGLIGARAPVALRIGGQGDWHTWRGAARATLGRTRVADLALSAREGRYALAGTVATSGLVQGKLQRLTQPIVRVDGDATLADRHLNGRLALASPALRLIAHGGIDLASSSFVGLEVETQLLQPRALFPNMAGSDARLHLRLDGPFRAAAFAYTLASPHIAFDQTGFDRVRAVGAGRFGSVPVAVPIRLRAARVTGIGDVAGGILADLSLAGVLHVDAKTVLGSGLALVSDKLRGTVALRLDLASGKFDIGVAGGLARYLIPGLGIVDVTTKASVLPGPNGLGTIVAGSATAIVRRFDNAFLRSLAGGNPRIDTKLARSPDGILHFSDLVLTGPSVRITGAGMRLKDGSFRFGGAGRQAVYGTLALTLSGMIDHPAVRLKLDRPLEALGLTQVALDLDPVAEGFQFQAAGGSTAGPFVARGLIHTPPSQPAVIDVADLAVTATHAHGSLRSDPQGFTGRLELAGGGIGGTIGFAPVGTIQRIDPHLTLAGATIATDEPVSIRRGALDGSILLDPKGIAVDGKASGMGLLRGGIALARAAAEAHLKGGQGRVNLAAAASRGAYDLTAALDLAPGRVTVSGQGSIQGRPVKLATPATLTSAGGAWTLAATRIDYAGGGVTLSGGYGGAATSVDAGLEHMPLGVFDVIGPNLGLGGTASGTLSYRRAGSAPPTGRLDLALHGLTRSGLVASSQPADIGVAAVLTPGGAAGRVVVASGGRTIGRAQARIGPLGPVGPSGDIMRRLAVAPLFAQIRYAGPAETPWRLIGVETIDLSGPLSVAADIGGTAHAPRVRGQISTNGARLESSATGTVVTGLQASGRFDGSRLLLDSMTGRAGTGGVTAKGSFDFSALKKGLGIDLAIQARDAALLARDDIGATVTGPLTIRSTGIGGTIGGDVTVDKGRFRLGGAAAAQVPHLAVIDVNRPETDEPDAAPLVPWTLDLKAHARDQLMVTGLGIDSEWKATLTIKGAVTDPAIGGRVDLVRGGYQFAGRRFDLDRGMIRFSGAAPVDPVLDITALADVQGLNATIHVTGTGLHPEISFESVPALPQDELLARLLFGTSITNLSAPEALQLASAVASLRGNGAGGGMFNLDPINTVRKLVRLDRLRILAADPTTGQKTAVAAGKYIGRRTYVELITDGQGYSATSVEFRITRWLSLLSTVSTVGRQSANIKVSKDY